MPDRPRQTTPGPARRDAERAGALAHDITNVLTTIVGYGHLLARSLEGDPRRHDVEEILLAAKRLAELVRDLETWSRAAEPAGEGTAGARVSTAAPRPDATPPGESARATVLVVDDERPVRYLVRAILGRAGYLVAEAATAGEAETWMAGRGGGVDLVISDLSMPGSGGVELADRLRRVQPGLRVLFISGHQDPFATMDGGMDPGIPFLQKPFTVESLTAAVERLLGR